MNDDDPSPLTRRAALATVALAGAGLALSRVRAQDHHARDAGTATPPPAAQPAVPALAGTHEAVPLPFRASALRGISERMITSHHDNNYAGAVRNLNRVEQQLAAVTHDTPPFLVSGLRTSELTFRNSKTLHEVYFAGLGGDGHRTGAIDTALAQAYGASSRWEEHFRATGASLGGGSGWVILALELDTGTLRTCWAGHHTQVLATSVPLLVMDMYEHAYQLDYAADFARYVDAYFQNVKWDEVNRRLEKARAASAAWRA